MWIEAEDGGLLNTEYLATMKIQTKDGKQQLVGQMVNESAPTIMATNNAVALLLELGKQLSQKEGRFSIKDRSGV